MKTLIIVRHAKSDWKDASLEDRERPLNDRGKRDAPLMAKRLRDKGQTIDLFLSSSAKRAKKTAAYFAEEYGKAKEAVVIAPDLYEPGVPSFNKTIAGLNNQYNTVALFSHNPGITDFVNTLTNTHIDNMPTCAVFAVMATTDNWAGFKESEKSLLFFDYPKNEPA